MKTMKSTILSALAAAMLLPAAGVSHADSHEKATIALIPGSPRTPSTSR